MTAAKHRKRILKELASNPAWRFAVGPAWLCPYCGEPEIGEGDTPTDADAVIERAMTHLVRCPSWDEFEGEPLPLADLEARAQTLRGREALRRALLANPAWQLYDVARRWYCPFCAEATGVKVREGGRISLSVLREIERHLAGCAAYEKGKGAEKPLAYLKSMVAYANRTEKMAEQIRKKIETDASWRLRDAEGRWVCLYCRKVAENIDFSTSLQMTEVAPREIAKHLIARCEAFRGAQHARDREASSASSATLEIARLGSASTSDVVRLSGSPPAAVSGEFPIVTGRAGAGAGAGARAAEPAAPEREGGTARAGGEAWRRSIHTTLSEVRSTVPTVSAAAPPGARAPEALPVPPEVEGLELRTFYRGARPHPSAVAEVTPIDARRIAVAIISIEGEGAESGLLLPIARNLLRAHGRAARAPGEALRLVAADLAAELDGRTFVCATAGIFDTRTLVYRFARAGSEAPLRWRPRPLPNPPGLALQGRPDGSLAEIESAPGLPIDSSRAGLDAAIVEREVILEPGDLLVQATRGAIAAENVDGAELSAARLHGLVRRYGNHEADYFIVKFGQFFEDWTRGAPLRDDACVLAMKVKETQ